jgi:hypothetical protein
MKKLNIEELTNEINKISSNEVYQDKRLNSKLSSRRIQDFISKDILQEGIREGRKKYFNDDHIDRLIKVRELQKEGLNDNQIVNFFNPKINKNSLTDILKSIEKREYNANEELVGNSTNNIKKMEEIPKYYTENILYKSSLSEEFIIGKNKDIILKIENNSKITDNDIKDINNILKQIQENNND